MKKADLLDLLKRQKDLTQYRVIYTPEQVIELVSQLEEETMPNQFHILEEQEALAEMIAKVMVDEAERTAEGGIPVRLVDPESVGFELSGGDKIILDYVDVNRDGLYDLVTEAVMGVLASYKKE